MFLKKITLKNIRSYKEQEITFPKGSTLLSGDIGSGKTSILLGIEFALFGLQPGQRGTALLKNNTDFGGVKIEFEVDGKEIIIERTLKKGKTISQDYCSIIIDGEKREISVTELKNQVLDLLNYPKEFLKKQNLLYRFTVYTPQEEMKQIILQDSATRINTLRYVFGIDKYKRILENTSVVLSKIREEKRRKEGMIDVFEKDKMELITKENELEDKHENLFSVEKELFLKTQEREKVQEEKQEIKKKIDEKRNFEQEIDKTKIRLVNKKETITSNLKLIEELKKQIDELRALSFDETETERIETEISLMKKEKEKLNETNLETTSKIASLQIKNQENERTKERLTQIELCPTCLQDVNESYKANVINKLNSNILKNNQDLESLNQEKYRISEKITQINSDVSSKETRLNEINILKIKLQGIQEKENRIQDIQKLNSSIESDLEILEKQMQSLQDSVFELKKFDNIFELKQNELETALKNEKTAEIKVAELKKEISVFSKQIDELKEKIKQAEEIKKEVEHFSNLEEWLSKNFIPLISFIEKNVMVKLKVEFSEFFSQWFNMLVLDTFNVKLNDEFTPIIEFQDYEINYEYLSGGERTAVALAYRLALNQVINSLLSKIKTKDVVILDEPTDGFSENQLDKMRDVLQQLNVEQLILVSHEQKIEGFVENVKKFKKENGISFIEG